MRSSSVLILVLALLALSSLIFAQDVSFSGTCVVSQNLNHSPDFENTTHFGPTPYTVVVPAGTDKPSLCINLTLNNIAGATLQVHSNLTDAEFIIYQDSINISLPLPQGESVFYPIDPFNRLPAGQPFLNSYQIQGPTSPQAYEFTVVLRVDNADMEIVNNYAFTWPVSNPPFTWAGQIYYQDILPENSKLECQVFNYSFQLAFADGLPVDLLVTTYGLDTVNGFTSTISPVAANTNLATFSGSFTAPEGVFEFRLLSEIQIANASQIVPSPFSIQFIGQYLNTSECEINNGPTKNGLTTPELIGIIVGSVVGFIILCFVLYCVYHKCCKRRTEYEQFD